MATGLKGMNQVQANLNREIGKMKLKSVKGLLDAAIFIKREMDTVHPKIPVDTNTLRASWFTYPGYVGGNPVVLLGFSANYAAFVHEMVDANFISPRVRYGPGKGRKRIYTPRKGSGPKFLETHLDRNHRQILNIIASKTRIR